MADKTLGDIVIPPQNRTHTVLLHILLVEEEKHVVSLKENLHPHRFFLSLKNFKTFIKMLIKEKTVEVTTSP